LLLQARGFVPLGLLVPTNSTFHTVISAGALLCSGLGGGPQLGEDQVVSAGDNCCQNSKPVGEVGFESDLITIAIAERFAGDIRENLTARSVESGGREELLGGLDETLDTLLPFCLGAIGLKSD
jgi:hypothetical protein